jgi:hypothetical protein
MYKTFLHNFESIEVIEAWSSKNSYWRLKLKNSYW